MNEANQNKLAPVLYLPHGGGPMPLLGDPSHAGMVRFWKEIAQQLPKPEAIVLISAHWEADTASITASEAPEMVYDYYNFPAETYEYKYPSPGNPALATQMSGMLTAKNIAAKLELERGYDHGMFVPMMLMYPEANIPCIQLSLLTSLDAQQHLDLGKALAGLREKNVLIIGSGMSFHSFPAMRRKSADDQKQSQAFDQWLVETCCSETLTTEERELRLSDWESAPSGRFCHPREEHLLPLHVCFGMAASSNQTAKHAYSESWNGLNISAFLWE
jgi:aromatic ring-opening dioxygenase catalytic subunit (LigB family)